MPVFSPFFRRLFLSGCLLLGAFVPLAVAQPQDPGQAFLSGLSAAERAAIGLDDLTPAQQEALAQAVERYVAGRNEAAVAVATEEVRTELAGELTERDEQLAATEEKLAAVEAELVKQTAETEKAQKEKVSLLERTKVLLTPGTKVEFATINAHLAQPFKGWKVGTLFRLDNGQVWRVADGKNYWAPREDAGKAVTIEPGSFGSFFIRIEGVKPTPKVELVSRN